MASLFHRLIHGHWPIWRSIRYPEGPRTVAYCRTCVIWGSARDGG